MAPDPNPVGVFDYGEWTWAQIQAAINVGDAKSLHDAGTDFEKTKTNLDDLVKTAKGDTERLVGPDGTWQGPASVAFDDLMTKLITNVNQHAVSLTPYKGALDDAGDALTTAKTDVKTAVGDAAQKTIEQYNNDVTAYNTAVTAYNAGTGPQPTSPGTAPYTTTGGQTTADVSRYPAIEAALNEKMRTIIATLAGKYQGSVGKATLPPDKAPPNPKDQPPPNLKTDLPPAKLPPKGDLLNKGDLAPPGPIANGVGNLNLVTKPGGLADLPKGTVPPPLLSKLDPALDGPLTAGLNKVPGAKFNGVLGNPNGLAKPGNVRLDHLVGPGKGPGAIGAPNAPNALLGGVPGGFVALRSGLTTPDEREPGIGAVPGVLGTSEDIRSDLVAPGGRVSGTPSSGIGRGGEPGSLGSGVPPMMAGGYGGMMSAGPDMEGNMFRDDFFAENEDDLGRNRKQSLVAGPEGETVVGGVYGGVEDERERKNEYTDTDDIWGSASASSPL